MLCECVVSLFVVVIYRKNENGEPAKASDAENSREPHGIDVGTEQREIKSPAETQPDTFRAIKEIDNVLKSICSVDENGKGQCEGCPYREHFFTDSELHFSS